MQVKPVLKRLIKTMITKEQAIQLKVGDIVHYEGKTDRLEGGCIKVIGIRGGVTINICAFRVSGKCQTWKTRPNDFSLPIKRGLKEHGRVWQKTYAGYEEEHHGNNDAFHVASECPLETGKVRLELTQEEMDEHKRNMLKFAEKAKRNCSGQLQSEVGPIKALVKHIKEKKEQS
jgi:hypothetical protein